ncbi:MAG: MlaD family protein [Pseudomonadota bacterium]
MRTAAPSFFCLLLAAGLLALPQPAAAQENLVDTITQRVTERLSQGAQPPAPILGGVPLSLTFESQVRGLEPGASVEIQGLRVGAVQAITLGYDEAARDFAVHVDIALQAERLPGLAGLAEAERAEATYALLERLIDQGLRARLASTELLGGTMVIELVMHPESPAASLDRTVTPPQLPVIPSRAEELRAQVRASLARLSELPIDQLFGQAEETLTALQGLVQGPELREALASLQEGTAALQDLSESLDGKLDSIVAEVNRSIARAGATFDAANETLASVRRAIGDRSPVLADVRRLLRELDGAARSLRLMVDYLERHPDALLRGKKDIRP